MRSLSKYFVRQSQQLKSVSTLTHTRSPALSFVAQKSHSSSSLCVPGPHSPSRLSGGALPVGITRLRSLSLLILIRETGVRLFGGEGSGRWKQGLLKRCGEWLGRRLAWGSSKVGTQKMRELVYDTETSMTHWGVEWGFEWLPNQEGSTLGGHSERSESAMHRFEQIQANEVRRG